MNEYKYTPKQKDDLFEYRRHKQTSAKDFLKYLLAKGLITTSMITEALQETNEDVTTSIANTIDEQTTAGAKKINTVIEKVLK